jgi:hypothetical protein
MNLLDYLLKQTRLWAFVFPQERSLERALALAFGILCGVGKRTLTRAISFQGNTQKDWSADYKVFSRSPWQSQELFHPIIQQAIAEQRPSCLDLVTLLRRQLAQNPQTFATGSAPPTYQTMVGAAAA